MTVGLFPGDDRGHQTLGLHHRQREGVLGLHRGQTGGGIQATIPVLVRQGGLLGRFDDAVEHPAQLGFAGQREVEHDELPLQLGRQHLPAAQHDKRPALGLSLLQGVLRLGAPAWVRVAAEEHLEVFVTQIDGSSSPRWRGALFSVDRWTSRATLGYVHEPSTVTLET